MCQSEASDNEQLCLESLRWWTCVATLDTSVTLRECLPPEHLARFIATVIAQLDREHPTLAKTLDSKQAVEISTTDR